MIWQGALKFYVKIKNTEYGLITLTSNEPITCTSVCNEPITCTSVCNEPITHTSECNELYNLFIF